MKEEKTLRLIFPQWQGGLNPDYLFGSELLVCIAPPSSSDETITVPIAQDFNAPGTLFDGVAFGKALLQQAQSARSILDEKQPDRIIVFGGDCSVSQIPFDYLGGRYQDQIGILWLDAHPDISTTQMTSHLHEMPLSNLLGRNPHSPLTRVEHPYAASRVFMAGLIEEDLRPMDALCTELKIRIGSPEELAADSRPVLDWIGERGIRYLAVHWDLDVLSPRDYRSIYPAEPYTEPKEFPAAVGRMTMGDIGRRLTDVSEHAEIVGLSIAEHLPWDAFNLRKTLASLSLFR